MKYVFLIAALMCIGGCETVTVIDHCTGWEPVLPHEGDSLTQATSDAQLKQLCTGYKFQCWNPPGIEQACKATPVIAPSTK
jgi:hypothetical protein